MKFPCSIRIGGRNSEIRIRFANWPIGGVLNFAEKQSAKNGIWDKNRHDFEAWGTT